MPVWCISSWEGVFCARVVCFQLGAVPVQLGGVVCASVVCFQLGGGRLCQCGVFPVGRGSSVLMWCASSFEGVICASVV